MSDSSGRKFCVGALVVVLVSLASACSDGTGTISGGADASMPDASGLLDTGRPADSGRDTGSGEDAAPLADAEADAEVDADGATPPEFAHYLYVVERDGDLHVYDLSDPASPALIDTTSTGGRATFGALHPGLDRFYVTNEDRVEGFDIAAFTPDPGGVGAMGVSGTHLDVTKEGEAVIVASFGGDAVVVVPLSEGVPGDATQTLGGAGDPLCLRAHQARVHPSNEWVYVPCRDSDHVARFAWNGGDLTPLSPATTADGMGPRHLDFHPLLDVVYVLGESNSTVEVFDVDTVTGDLSRRQTISTMAERSGSSASSDIHVSPDGRFLYAMNRQPMHDIALFEIDQVNGELTWVENVSSGGEHSRSFVLHPTGELLYAAHSDTLNVAIFDVAADGRLTSLDGLDGFDSRVSWVGVESRPLR